MHAEPDHGVQRWSARQSAVSDAVLARRALVWLSFGAVALGLSRLRKRRNLLLALDEEQEQGSRKSRVGRPRARLATVHDRESCSRAAGGHSRGLVARWTSNLLLRSALSESLAAESRPTVFAFLLLGGATAMLFGIARRRGRTGRCRNCANGQVAQPPPPLRPFRDALVLHSRASGLAGQLDGFVITRWSDAGINNGMTTENVVTFISAHHDAGLNRILASAGACAGSSVQARDSSRSADRTGW